jgi:Putative zinc-finger
MDERAVDRFVRSALEANPPTAGSHPDPDALFAYFARELSPAEADVIQAHVARCRECARVVADFEAFPALDAPSEDDVPTDEETAAGWADLLTRLEREPVSAEVAALAARHTRHADVLPLSSARPTPRPRQPAWRQGAFQTLAATAALTILGLGSYGVQQRRARVQAELPAANPAIVQLDDPSTRFRGGMQDPDVNQGTEGPHYQSVSLDARAPVVVMYIPYADREPPPSFRAQLWRGENTGSPIYDVLGLVRDGDGILAMSIAPQRLPAGRYRLSLLSDTGKLLNDYRFEVTYTTR